MGRKLQALVWLWLAFPVLSLGATDTCRIAGYFSPSDDIESVIAEELAKAQQTVLCSLYGISNKVITSGLLALLDRGVTVTICLDKKQSRLKSSTHHELARAGANIIIKRSAQPLEHCKVCVVDGRVVLEGSWNYSEAARLQDNTFNVISGCKLVERYDKAMKRIYERDSR